MKMSSQSFLSSRDIRQFFRFVMVGCSNFAISFTVFYLCYERWHVATLLLNGIGGWGERIFCFVSDIGIESPEGALANTLGYTLGTMNSFFWNRVWTFNNLSDTPKRLNRFIILNISCLALSTIIILIFVDVLGWHYETVWLVTMGFMTVLNFVGSKFWVFN